MIFKTSELINESPAKNLGGQGSRRSGKPDQVKVVCNIVIKDLRGGICYGKISRNSK